MRSCVICGCHQLQACVTDEGPCHWADDYLCSACVGTVCDVDPNLAGVVYRPAVDDEILDHCVQPLRA